MEKVLVISIGQLPATFASETLITDHSGLSSLDSAQFMDRPLAETDERFRQLIPYVVLRQQDQLFSYVRTRRGHEHRLHEMRSLGVGGHVNPSDLPESLAALRDEPIRVLSEAARREIGEEVNGFGSAELKWLGFICSNATEVERVHLGIVYVADVDADSIELTQEGRMSDAHFAGLDELNRDKSRYEGWSAIVIDHLVRESNRK